MLAERATRIVDAGRLDDLVMILFQIGDEYPPQMRLVIYY